MTSTFHAPLQAREHTRTLLHSHGMSELIDNAELVVSELVTNAVHATNTLDERPITLAIFTALDHLVIEVWDTSTQLPCQRQATSIEEKGRGLSIVDYLTSYYDVIPHIPAGKVVRAFLPLRTESAEFA